MKQWLRKIFFWDESPQGAHFGLTLFFLVPWIWLSLCFWISAFILQSDPIIFNVHKDAILRLFTGITIFIVILVAVYGNLLLLHLCIANRKGFWKHLPWGKLFLGVTFIAISICLYIAIILKIFITCNCIGSEHIRQLAPTFFNAISSGNKTFIAVALIVALLAVGYISLGKTIAGIGQVPYSQLWTRGVKSLWAYFIMIYLLSWGIGLQAVYASRKAVAGLEKTLGRSITNQAVAEVYFHGQQPDADFWATLLKTLPDNAIRIKHNKQLGRSDDDCYAASDFDLIFHSNNPYSENIPQDIINYWQTDILNMPEMKAWEALFDKPLPPNARDYSDSQLFVKEALPEGSHCFRLYDYEQWRIRLALEAKDFPAVETALARMRRASEFMEHDTFFYGGIVWVGCESYQLDTLARIIESRLPSDDWIRQLDHWLESREHIASQVMQNGIHGQVTYSLNLLKMFWRGKAKTGGVNSIYFGMVSFLMPQLLYVFANEYKGVADMCHHFLDPDFPYEDRQLMFFHDIWSELVHAKVSTKEITAQCRIMRGLVAAELYRRQHGSFPQELTLLEDPFNNGQPLKYQCGEVNVIQYVWNVEQKKGEPLQRKFQGVKIWTVGLNRQDNGGIRTYEGRQDDINLWLRDK